jgi:hypothetical protein
VTAAGATSLSFNAQQLGMIAASRKKTDRRDAYGLAKALHAGMYPHPIYIPPADIRALRVLLSRQRLPKAEHNPWLSRARAALRAANHRVPAGATALRTTVTTVVNAAITPPLVRDTLALCQRQEATLRAELRQVETTRGVHAGDPGDRADERAGDQAAGGGDDLRHRGPRPPLPHGEDPRGLRGAGADDAAGWGRGALRGRSRSRERRRCERR